jgi:hypothetical protein
MGSGVMSGRRSAYEVAQVGIRNQIWRGTFARSSGRAAKRKQVATAVTRHRPSGISVTADSRSQRKIENWREKLLDAIRNQV